LPWQKKEDKNKYKNRKMCFHLAVLFLLGGEVALGFVEGEKMARYFPVLYKRGCDNPSVKTCGFDSSLV
jgi:hypothetical protein